MKKQLLARKKDKLTIWIKYKKDNMVKVTIAELMESERKRAKTRLAEGFDVYNKEKTKVKMATVKLNNGFETNDRSQ